MNSLLEHEWYGRWFVIAMWLVVIQLILVVIAAIHNATVEIGIFIPLGIALLIIIPEIAIGMIDVTIDAFKK